MLALQRKGGDGDEYILLGLRVRKKVERGKEKKTYFIAP